MVLSKFANKSFFTRLLSGIVLVALMLATIIPGGNILFVANLLISVVGVYELYKVLGIEKNSLGITGYIAVLAYYAVLYFDKKEYMMILMVVFLMCLLAQYVFMFPKYKTEQISNAIMSMLYAGVMLSYLYSVREGNNGAYTVWLIFLCSWGSDTCAYLAGVAFGKHKMAPRISPNKSWEGFVGGLLGSCLTWIALYALKVCGISLLLALIGGLVCGVSGVIGDLFESRLKRAVGVKDSGNLIPGHGGLLDRSDSMLFATMTAYFVLHIGGIL